MRECDGAMARSAIVFEYLNGEKLGKLFVLRKTRSNTPLDH